MTSIETFLVIGVIVAGWGYWKVIRSRMGKVGTIILLGRWLAGKPWHGHAITDAGFSRKGTKVFTETGHASWFWHQTGRRRLLLRCGGSFVLLRTIAGLLLEPRRTVIELLVLLVIGGGVGMLWGLDAWDRRKHHSQWVVPLHLALHDVVRWPVAMPAKDWLTVTPNREFVQIRLPVSFKGEKHELKRIDDIVSARLALEAPIPRRQLGGASPSMSYTASKPPPALVPVEGLMEPIEAAPGDVAVLGRGKKGQVVAVNFAQDSPHLGVSMPPDTGKTSIARLILAQMLRKGWLALILDWKLMSHMWAYDCPNVWYAAEVGEIHAAAVWLSGEIDRRKKDALAIGRQEGGRSGRVYTEVGPRVIVCYEEANATARLLRDYWHEHRLPRQPKYSPAIRGLEQGHFSARELGINFMTFAQMLSARAALSPEARETMGTRIVGSYTLNNWRMMAPEHPMPASSRHKGRVQVIAGGAVTETQVGWIEDEQAHALALSGSVARWAEIGETATPASIPTASDQQVVTVAGQVINPARRLIGLAEAAEKKIIPVSLSAAKMRRHRDKAGFPPYRDRKGLEILYDAAELKAYFEEIEQSRRPG